MEFDATFIISAISFIVFVFIMNKIFYAPIFKIMKDRKNFIKQNSESTSQSQKETQEKIQYRNNELDKSREEARSFVVEETQKLKVEKDKSVSLYKEELLSNVAKERENLKKSAYDAKETLKDNVVDIAKDITQMLLGDSIDKNTIDKSKIEE